MTQVQLAVVYHEPGGPEVLHLVEVPEAHPGPGQVRVAVRAVGLNPFDVKVRTGAIPMQLDYPRGIGQDFAGVVDEVGEEASYDDGVAVRVGDEVLGWSAGPGAARTQLLVPASHLARKPPDLDWSVAGALQTSGLTAYACLERLAIGADDVVLVSAAAGGVGLVYTQLAAARGATVIATAGPSNQEFLRGLGAIPVTYGEGLAERVRDVAQGPVTAVQDNHGREAALAGLELGVPADRIVVIADHAAVDELGVSSPGRYERLSGNLARVAQAMVGRQLPVRRFPLADVVAAYAELESGHGRGKVVLEI